MLPRFTLSPWEFPGVPGSRRAGAVTQAQWRGREVTMRLKVRENRLFFAPVGEKGGRLFSVFGPLEKTAEDAYDLKSAPDELVARFHRALNEGLWGRVVFCKQDGLDLAVSTSVMVILRRDGKMELRQLYDDEFIPVWVDWKNLPRFGLDLSHFEVWPHTNIAAFLSSQLKVALNSVRARNVSQAAWQRGEIEMLWLQGSQGEIEMLIRATAHLFANFSVAQPGQPTTKLYYNVMAQYVLDKPQIITGNWPVRTSSPPIESLFNLFLKICHPVKQVINPLISAKGGGIIITSVAVEPPTHHEKLEALHTLREMTRGTKIEADVEAVLQKFLPQTLHPQK